ncbi:MAG: phosphatidate cytidylyltransferase [Alphaproteobacteria bacterium]
MNDASAGPAAEAKRRSAELRRRLVAAVPLAAAALGLAYVGGWPFYAAVALVVVGMAYEWLRLSLGPTPSGRREPWLAAIGVLAIVVVGLAAGWLRGGPGEGRAFTLWLFGVVWATDTGAYLVGRAVGGPRLWPRLSPNKTWAGALGGLAAAVAVAVGLGYGVAAAGWTAGLAAPARLALAGLLVGLLAEAGDLLESAMKRRYKVKDAGGLIPGHGGLLDRLDGYAPAALGLCLAVLIGGGESLLWVST